MPCEDSRRDYSRLAVANLFFTIILRGVWFLSFEAQVNYKPLVTIFFLLSDVVLRQICVKLAIGAHVDSAAHSQTYD